VVEDHGEERDMVVVMVVVKVEGFQCRRDIIINKI
jgi:hypothetical protein